MCSAVRCNVCGKIPGLDAASTSRASWLMFRPSSVAPATSQVLAHREPVFLESIQARESGALERLASASGGQSLGALSPRAGPGRCRLPRRRSGCASCAGRGENEDLVAERHQGGDGAGAGRSALPVWWRCRHHRPGHRPHHDDADHDHGPEFRTRPRTCLPTAAGRRTGQGDRNRRRQR